MKKFQKRKKLLVSKRFQTKYICLILLFMFIAALVTGYTVYFTTWSMFGEKLAAVYPQGLLFDIVKKVNMVLLMRLFFLSPVVVFIALVLSNRIAGPIYSMKVFLNKVRDGKYEERLRLRKKDELHDLAGSINNFVSGLNEEKNKRLRRINILKGHTEKLYEGIMTGEREKEEVLKIVKRMKEEIEGIAG
ncbi:MAG: hypothetical protein ABIH09_06095 [Candidatus Omnitrophota bacterium]